MNKLLILLLLVANYAFAQEKMKEAMPAGGLLNKKIKQTKWYFDAGLITDGMPAASPRAKKLASFLQQRLNVHYDLSEKTMDFVQDDISPIVPSISN